MAFRRGRHVESIAVIQSSTVDNDDCNRHLGGGCANTDGRLGKDVVIDLHTADAEIVGKGGGLRDLWLPLHLRLDRPYSAIDEHARRFLYVEDQVTVLAESAARMQDGRGQGLEARPQFQN